MQSVDYRNVHRHFVPWSLLRLYSRKTAKPPPAALEMLAMQQQQQQQQQPQPSPPTTTATEKRPQVTLHSLQLKYARNQPISMLTAYDYPSARLADAAGVDVLLVGDSLGMVVLGREDTTDVTMDEMVHHCKAARKGAERALVIGDLPFGSCLTPVEAARNGVRLVKEGRVDAVKIEGGERMVPQIKALVDAGVAVMGHIGLTPQSYVSLGGYRVQGRTADEAMTMLRDAKALQDAGCFGIVIEMVPTKVAALLTEQLAIPTVGIGAGGETSGQVQVFHDVLGLYDKFVPKFVRQFAQMEAPVVRALEAYAGAVDARSFPAASHSFNMDSVELVRFSQEVAKAEAEEARVAAASGRPPRAMKKIGGGGFEGGGLAPGAAPPTAAGGLPSAASRNLSSSPPVGKPPTVVKTLAAWRALEESGVLPPRTCGVVPTMGALHEGHLSLMRRAKREHGVSAASVFVNPTQFAADEDLSTYPRPWEKDLDALTRAGVDFVFAPSADEMYPPHQPALLSPFIDLKGVDETTREGASRPLFFRGVATVVAKLLNITQPKAVYFDQKDGMQCIVVRRLIEDLNFNVLLVVGDTVREADGLAMSSRNVYLSPPQRATAPAVYAALAALKDAFCTDGERCVDTLKARAAAVLRTANAGAAKEPDEENPVRLDLEYLSLASGVSGQEYAEGASLAAGQPTLASIAVRVGTTRLIDNVLLGA